MDLDYFIPEEIWNEIKEYAASLYYLVFLGVLVILSTQNIYMPCSLYPPTKRCRKSQKSDGNCYQGPKKRCRKNVTQKRRKKQPSGRRSSPTVHQDIGYLNHLHQEYFDYQDAPSKKRYPRGKAVPFDKIDKFVDQDMMFQYEVVPETFYPGDSGNWGQDKKKLKVGDIILDDNNAISRTNIEAWLVINKNKKKHLVMFPMSDGDMDNDFRDGDTTNGKGLWIHPITRQYIHISGTEL